MDEELLKVLEERVKVLEEQVTVLEKVLNVTELPHDTYVVTSGTMPKFSSKSQQECEDFAEKLGAELAASGADINNPEYVIEIQLQ